MPSLTLKSQNTDGDTPIAPCEADTAAWLSYTAYPAGGGAVSSSAAGIGHEVETAQKSKKHSIQQKELTPESDQKSESFPDPYPEESKLIESLNAPKPPRQRIIDDPTPLSMVNRTNIRRLFRMEEFSNSQSSALGYGLRNIRLDLWARAFEGYAKRLALAITSEGNFNAYRLCRCFYKRLCGITDFCPRCGKIIQKELKAQFGKSFPRAPHWMTFTLSFDSLSSRAGLRYTTQKDKFGRVLRAPKLLNPFKDQPDRQTLGADVESQPEIQLLARTALDFVSALEANEQIKGALASRELAVEFIPFANGRVEHAAYVNVHVTVCMDQPLTRDLARQFYDQFCTACEDSGASDWGYPNMLVSKLESQTELNRWLTYSNKTIPVEDFYEQAIKDGCDIQSLNAAFDEVLWCIKRVFDGVRNRRRVGVMRLKSPKDKQYIGKPTKTQLERRSRNSEFKKFMKQTDQIHDE